MYNEHTAYYLSKFRLSFVHWYLCSGDIALSVRMNGWLSLLILSRTESTIHRQCDISMTRCVIICVRYLRTRSEKRIVDPLYLLVFIVPWSRKNDRLCCFYDCLSETETTVNNELCLCIVSCYFGYTER